MKIEFFNNFFGELVDGNLIFKYDIRHASKYENLKKFEKKSY